MTIYDIAEKLGVSAATVSLALNGDSRVAEKTRLRVQAFAAEQGFSLNVQARNFRLKRTYNVALVVHNIDNDFWHGIVRAIEAAMGEKYSLLICNTEGDPAQERKVLRNLIARKVDGIIIQAASRDERQLEEAVRSDIPVVTLEETENPLLSFVKGDDFDGARCLTRRALAAGLRKIGFVSWNVDSLGVRRRLEGFRAALAEAGATDCRVLVAADDTAEAVCDRIAGSERDFELLICADGRMVWGLAGALAERGIRVPEDLALATWSNNQLFAFLTPPVTTVEIPMAEIGAAAAEIILSRLAGGGMERAARLVPERLVERRSLRFHTDMVQS